WPGWYSANGCAGYSELASGSPRSASCSSQHEPGPASPLLTCICPVRALLDLPYPRRTRNAVQAAGEPLLMAWLLRVNKVGCLPERPGYPVPWPQPPKLLHQLGKQVPQGGQVQHSWFALVVHQPSGLGGIGRRARLLCQVADDSFGKAGGVSKCAVLAVGIDTGTARHIGGATWWQVLRHHDHPFPRSGEHSMPHWRDRSLPAFPAWCRTENPGFGLAGGPQPLGT